MGNQINFVVNGTPSNMVPKKVNLFMIQTTDNGIFLDCLFNTKQIDDKGNCPVFVADRFAVDPADLKSLADSITEHLTKTGYFE